jgi:uncharacterized membrane protein
MATFESIFPTFLTMCGDLHTLLLSVAFALFITGILVTVHHRFSPKILMHLLMRILLLTSLLVFLPGWGNTLQTLLQSSVLSGLGIDPARLSTVQSTARHQPRPLHPIVLVEYHVPD